MSAVQVQKTTEVRNYFTERAQLFDALYEADSAFSRNFNKVFRRSMFVRYAMTLDALGDDLTGQHALDVGCGAGRYSVELARKGAKVTGVDFSPEMIGMASENARAANLSGQATFVEADFLTWAKSQTQTYDVAFAMGVLDYVEDAETFVTQMAKLARRVIISFPRPTLVRSPLRKLRYALRGCPVHFYTRNEVIKIYQNAGLEMTTLAPLDNAGFWADGKRTRS
jgi:2-polyprenyl-3-methyl-5-hydroxy-6-metoxy-1,4-benzoquinol methylase